ncbi:MULTISPECIES: M28 family peptidase [Acidobacteriaceae]|uniref:M28 family peptidase n=1 Tax=Acidobacteriaceae TaxID=204434 RepID=UPI0020B15538|nr:MULTISPECIES: M28 family peptidase [Acidobacteriaceae]MDW5264990.1 M20/M25/M40 family metallo-hydrolase [Edaphobacter sp.]
MSSPRRVSLFGFAILLWLPIASPALNGQRIHSFDSLPSQTASILPELQREVHADMAFLADDELHGRGSATRDEHIAALFAASQFQSLGLEPGGDNGTFLQKVPLPNPLPADIKQRLSKFEDTPRKETWNAIAILRGSSEPNEVILLTAHLDHLGIGPAVNGDSIYNGADDDASGTTAVLALAHILATGHRPRRTIVFALFGSEEIGGFGNRAFLAHPAVPLTSIVANLEFEMIGRPDPTVPAGTLWLTGFSRTNLGPELAKHGAHLVNDPHMGQHFFRRSDNYALALQGIIAQTVSSFGLHKDYHQPSDELRSIDFTHMTHAIASMVAPVNWLANTTWKPQWNFGRKPWHQAIPK